MIRIRWRALAALAGVLVPVAVVLAQAPPAAPSETPFTLVAIGDTGTLTQELYDNAVGVTEQIQRAKPGQRALLFLGDNFYQYGLSRDPIAVRERRYRTIYEDLFGAAMRTLVVDGCSKDAGGAGGSNCAAGAVNYVHAVAGNHDYYSGALSFAGLDVLPTGFSTEGNEYCRVRGLLTPEEREALEKTAATQEAPQSQGAPAKPVQAPKPWRWRYHFDLPKHEYWPIDPTRPDSPEIHVIFFDSASIVRAAENCGQRALKCPGVRVDEDDPENPLSCIRAQAALCRLKEHLDSEKDRPSVRWRVFVAHHPFWTVGAHGGYSWSAVEGEAVWADQCSKATDPQGWFKNMQFDPEDECAPGWQWYVRQLAALMKDRKPFDIVLAGHDHSLQLLQPSEEGSGGLARLQIISGAGAKTSVVRGPGARKKPGTLLERVYTASAGTQGESRPGFVGLRFYSNRIHVQFFEGWKTLAAAGMAPPDEAKFWQGKSCFVVDHDGLIDPDQECKW
jgi:hypothetical protein